MIAMLVWINVEVAFMQKFLLGNALLVFYLVKTVRILQHIALEDVRVELYPRLGLVLTVVLLGGMIAVVIAIVNYFSSLSSSM